MKNIFIFVFFIFTSFYTFSQTTMEEYNYITKGYRIQIESGLDMKKGYILKDYYTYQDTGSLDYNARIRNVQFKALYKTGKSKPVALMMIWKRTDNGYKGYYCIPQINSSDEIWQKAKDLWYNQSKSWGKSVNSWNKVNQYSPATGYYYTWGMIKFISFQFSK